MKKLVSGLIPLLFLPLGIKNPFNKSDFERNKFEEFVPEVSLRLDNNFERYKKYFPKEMKFWKAAFTLDSTKTLVYMRNTMDILDTIKTPLLEEEERVIDSLYDFYKEDRAEKTLGIVFGRKQKMERSITRAFNHLDYIVDSLEKNNLPTSLAALPLVESGFRDDARSWAGAVGMWQFMPETARHLGLKVNRWRDDRKNPQKSLSAFIKYMKNADERFDSDLLMLVSYNVGLYSKYFENRETRNDVAIVKDMGFAPRQYAASFLVCLDILKNPCEYFDLDFNKEKKKHYYFDFASNSLEYYYLD